MRRLVLLFAFVSVSAAAQTATVDTSLVNRLTRVLGLDADVSIGIRSTDATEATAAPTMVSLGDSVEVAIVEEYDPALLEDALSFLEGPAFQRLEASQRAWFADQSPEDMMALMSSGGPPDAPRADSALVVDYVDAQIAATRPDDIRHESFQVARAQMDPAARSVLDDAGFFSAMTSDGGQGDARARFLAIRSARLQLADADPADVRAVASYYRSEAGRHVERQVALGRSRAQLPVLVSSLESMAEQFRTARGQ
ncbi:hypothetical protein [Rubrivirga sp.]|uniref:hypothetical protein n=1 Tax=Rubrivirga sp. TaxID=1885344 RepID=UPI003C7252B6